ncbi:unnamed protein product [Schistosoma guineensis]|nr:unnamed protein product [Schistosoma guineensis]
MFFNCRTVALSLPVFACTSAADPPCSSMMLPRYVKDCTSPRVSPSSVIGLLFSVWQLGILLLPLCMLRLSDSDAAATLLVFIFICLRVWDRRARSSAKSNSSS